MSIAYVEQPRVEIVRHHSQLWVPRKEPGVSVRVVNPFHSSHYPAQGKYQHDLKEQFYIRLTSSRTTGSRMVTMIEQP